MEVDSPSSPIGVAREEAEVTPATAEAIPATAEAIPATAEAIPATAETPATAEASPGTSEGCPVVSMSLQLNHVYGGEAEVDPNHNRPNVGRSGGSDGCGGNLVIRSPLPYDHDGNEGEHQWQPNTSVSQHHDSAHASTADTNNEAESRPSTSGQNVLTDIYKRPKDGPFIGLVNQGMTCYLNVLVQALFMTPEFRDMVWSWDKPDMKRGSKLYELQRLFIALKISPRTSLETRPLTKSFGWISRDSFVQHDIQELWRVLFDVLDKEMGGGKASRRLHDEYEGYMLDYVKCVECGNGSNRVVPYQDIPLVVKPYGQDEAYESILESLEGFVTPERLDGSNQYFCETCKKKCDADKGISFLKFPHILTFQLKRFDYNFNTGSKFKLNDRVTFPEFLDMTVYKNQEQVETYLIPFLAAERSNSEEDSKANQSSSTDTGLSENTSLDLSPISPMSEDSDGDLPQDVPIDLSMKTLKNNNGDANQEDDNDAVPQSENSDAEMKDVGGPDGSSSELATQTDDQVVPSAPKNDGRLPRGMSQDMYELYAVLVHSGSAAGGHYYAYIKSVETGQWFKFNDRCVTKVDGEQVQDAYGGTLMETGLVSSSSAYMLIYRRVDNTFDRLKVESIVLPKHLEARLHKLTEDPLIYGPSSNDDKDVFTLKTFVFYRPPEYFQWFSASRYPWRHKRVYVNSTDAVKVMKHSVMDLLALNNIDKDALRIFRMDRETGIIINSLSNEEEAIAKAIDIKDTKNLSFLLSMRDPDGSWTDYPLGSCHPNVVQLDVVTGEVLKVKDVVVSMTATVEVYKQQIIKEFNMDLNKLVVVIDVLGLEPRILFPDDASLKELGLTCEVRVFVAEVDPQEQAEEDWFAESALCQLVKRLQQTVHIYVILPQSENNIPYTIEQLNQSALWRSSRTCESRKWHFSCVDPELSRVNNIRRILVTCEKIATLTWLTVQLAGLMCLMPENIELRKLDILGGSNDEKLNKQLNVIQNLGPLQFDYSNINGATSNSEVRKPEKHHYPSVELKVVLKPNDATECRSEIHLLVLTSFENPFPYSVQMSVKKVATIGQAKRQAINLMREKHNIVLQYDMCRLRRMVLGRYVGQVLHDKDSMADEFCGSNFWELILQEVPVKARLFCTVPSAIFIFARRYFPITNDLGPICELLLESGSSNELVHQLEALSTIPPEYLALFIGRMSYPTQLSPYVRNSPGDWSTDPTVTAAMFQGRVTGDGSLVFYMDKRELESKLNENNGDRVQPTLEEMQNSLQNYRRERPLQILEDSELSSSASDTPTQSPQHAKRTNTPDNQTEK